MRTSTSAASPRRRRTSFATSWRTACGCPPIGELTSSIAHELNQPLAAILANAQAARRLLAGVPPQSRHQEIDEILETSSRRTAAPER